MDNKTLVLLFDSIGIRELAIGLGISHQTIYQWKKVPAERVLKIEELTGLSRHTLRPDIYPKPST